MMRNQRGVVFVVVMLITIVLLTLSLVFLAFTLTHLGLLAKITGESRTKWEINAGVNQMVYDLKMYYYSQDPDGSKIINREEKTQ